MSWSSSTRFVVIACVVRIEKLQLPLWASPTHTDTQEKRGAPSGLSPNQCKWIFFFFHSSVRPSLPNPPPPPSCISRNGRLMNASRNVYYLFIYSPRPHGHEQMLMATFYRFVFSPFFVWRLAFHPSMTTWLAAWGSSPSFFFTSRRPDIEFHRALRRTNFILFL